MKTIKVTNPKTDPNFIFGDRYGIDWWYEKKGSNTICVPAIPGGSDIEQVSIDESGRHDWNNLSGKQNFEDGFKDGANWMLHKFIKIINL